MENNNKESFKLLGMSESGSDSGSIPEFVVAPKKRKLKRKVRGLSGSRVRHSEPCACRGRTVGLSLAVTLLLCWLIVLTWLAVVLHSELKRLDSNVYSVVAGSQSVPDALQKCHSLSKGLQQNQTLLFVKLDSVNSDLGNISAQLIAMQHSLSEVQAKLKAAPELVNVPQNLLELKGNVASFGSKIIDFESTVNELKDQNNKLQEKSKMLDFNITNIKETVANLMNASQQSHGTAEGDAEEKKAIRTLINQLSQNLTSVNGTLNSKFQWIIDDQNGDHKNLGALEELGQNVSARLSTLEGECAKASAQASLVQQIGNLTDRVASSEGQLHDLTNRLAQFQSNNSQLIMAVNNMRETISQLSSQNSYASEQAVPMETQG